jgi:hypothetical protein
LSVPATVVPVESFLVSVVPALLQAASNATQEIKSSFFMKKVFGLMMNDKM